MIKMIMEAIILISWQYKTMKMRNNSKTKHLEKIIISRSKNNNYNSNSNDLKGGKNHRFEKKETLIWTGN